MKDIFTDELKRCGQMLESLFHDMVDFEFTIENEKLYILGARVGKRTIQANLKIIISMFCEGKMSVEDVFQKLPYYQIVEILDVYSLSNLQGLELLSRGLPASSGVVAAKVCFSSSDAWSFINRQESFIFCVLEISPEDIEILQSKYCMGVISARGGMTSHAAVVCRGLRKPCVSGFGNFNDMMELAIRHNNELTIDGNSGSIYAGFGYIEKNNDNLEEIKILRQLLQFVVKNNIITEKSAPLVWRMWDVVLLNKRYGSNNSKRVVGKRGKKYISFVQPETKEIEKIYSILEYVENGNIIVEDLIGFLFDELSAQVPLGRHYLYMRPVLDPMIAIKNNPDNVIFPCTQLTGIEFFHVNKYVDFLLDIYSIKVFFSTNLYCSATMDEKVHGSFNCLDYTNPHGESLIIHSYDANKVAVYINDVHISSEELPLVYHLLRRRKYYWSWYRENNVSKRMVVDYLKGSRFNCSEKDKLYYLCEEMHLIQMDKLTLVGKSLVEETSVEESNGTSKNIDYIVDEVLLRGYNDNSSVCNDFSKLIHRKDFKDLIALEIYEYYFWNDRHEFDLQLIKEIVESIAAYFSNPEVIQQIESGILQNVPSAIIISSVAAIWAKIKKINKKHNTEGNSAWEQLKKNTQKIDEEFANHDYVLAEEIETVFGTSREEILPLLKLCGYKCYIHKNRSIWIKPGIKEERIKDILRTHHFKYKR